MKSFSQIASEIAETVERKNQAYGNSFDVSAEFLRLLYPDGVKPEQYPDLLTLTRIFDKLKRVATANDPDGESPYADLVGYGLLALRRGALGKPERHPDIDYEFFVPWVRRRLERLHCVACDTPLDKGYWRCSPACYSWTEVWSARNQVDAFNIVIEWFDNFALDADAAGNLHQRRAVD